MPILIVLAVVLLSLLFFGPLFTGTAAFTAMFVAVLGGGLIGAVVLGVLVLMGVAGLIALFCWGFWRLVDPGGAKEFMRISQQVDALPPNERNDEFLHLKWQQDRKADGTDALIPRRPRDEPWLGPGVY